MLTIATESRVRILTLNRPEALNAFNEALYDAVAEALIDAAADPGVAVVVVTGAGRAFSAGTDLAEMAARTVDPSFTPGVHGFPGMIDALIDCPKPVIAAINGLGLGVGATLVGLADLVLMSADARLKCPFTDLGVAPEAGSSYLFPQLLGHQQATWMLLSSDWINAEECARMGLAWRVCPPEALIEETMSVARHLAAKPISSLVESKAAIVAPRRQHIAEARARENAAFSRLLGGPANSEALRAFAEKRPADFANLPPGW